MFFIECLVGSFFSTPGLMDKDPATEGAFSSTEPLLLDSLTATTEIEEWGLSSSAFMSFASYLAIPALWGFPSCSDASPGDTKMIMVSFAPIVGA